VTELPSGTVTFLFTDLEGSTRLWQEHPDAMQPALARHDEIVRNAIAAHGGVTVKTTGTARTPRSPRRPTPSTRPSRRSSGSAQNRGPSLSRSRSA
jgi:Adenylate and Guanylate cyclase catalytic domain